MVVQKCEVIKVEAIVRGYITGTFTATRCGGSLARGKGETARRRERRRDGEAEGAKESRDRDTAPVRVDRQSESAAAPVCQP